MVSLIREPRKYWLEIALMVFMRWLLAVQLLIIRRMWLMASLGFASALGDYQSQHQLYDHNNTTIVPSGIWSYTRWMS
jgi:hypothetical protein